jgi:predicted RNA-binding protein (virulence factor B family)
LSSEFQAGDKVQVEVVQFGPLGASVQVIGRGHGDDAVLLSADEEPLGTGLILQKEISYFRQARNMVDVVRGEILPAFVQNVRDEDGKLDIGLRAFGGKAKAQEVGDVILEILEQRADGVLPIGDKSAPEEINRELPGVSKGAFKKAVGALYKKGLIQPSPNSLKLVAKKD